MHSLTEENYLKAIYHLSERSDGAVSTNSIAEKMDTKAASVTDMLKKLAEKKLIQHKKYQGVRLNDLGEKVALSVIRKHRLWELFLVEKLSFKWDEVHDVAEQLEHIQSEKLIHELDAFLGHPRFDPHGELIPDSKGNFPKVKTSLLSECALNVSLKVMGVCNHSVDFLTLLDSFNIHLGANLVIVEKNTFDSSLKVQIDGQKELYLSKEVSENILIFN